ncbi:hypothetical protein HMPREF1991_01887 [Hoylesella loescheii DSM 19665 = JCM 12249 = ATCC 15930]|uniref:Uncharacterized protein n=1 Tax=Hoylesella loescheii DSM 19665 = JCM 12249 = ATCC 15930 TaxID=1122985 RepID=A0A069QQC2_HOYLO|nr:hypothetical protein HMPREF1991_01887 [Hoylesella loescheii DSM 19665 = JCM 12249 = ATCC 15930]
MRNLRQQNHIEIKITRHNTLTKETPKTTPSHHERLTRGMTL